MAELITALAAIAALCLTVAGAALGFAISEDRRITRLEERVRTLGQQLLQLPKRRTDKAAND